MVGLRNNTIDNAALSFPDHRWERGPVKVHAVFPLFCYISTKKSAANLAEYS